METNQWKEIPVSFCGKENRLPCPHQTSNQFFLNKDEESKLSTKPPTLHHLPAKTSVYILIITSELPLSFNSQIQIPYALAIIRRVRKEEKKLDKGPKCRRVSFILVLSKRSSKHRLPMRPRIATSTSRWWERWKWGYRRMRGEPLPKWRWTFERY